MLGLEDGFAGRTVIVLKWRSGRKDRPGAEAS
jgi:hypothetical protein